ncbi:putative cystathionine gamma-lyase 2 [Hyalella azteca]|uniref:cystathionine gamma-lyase n=1 Tax=Hyalella azteca TaxID=294128 RepID=A0A8B7NCM9_HYAAZ|nr:putative cystathionine gamma-lyase 2 [Hyalella azteca]
MDSSSPEDAAPSPYPRNAPSLHTRAIHVGFEPRGNETRALVPPLTLATTFAQADPQHKGEYFYGRLDNPSRAALERSLAALEEAEYAVTFASGTAAISSVMQLLRAGDHVLVSHHLYSGTWTFLTKIAARQGLVVEFIDMRQASEVAAALKPSTRIVWFESPSNPTMDLVDIAAVATIVQQHNQRVGLEHLSLEQPIADKRNELDVEARAILVVDNTFMTGVLQRPLLLGADLVVHSCTKYINGSTDVIMGVVCTSSKNLHEKLKFIQTASGAIPSPFDCYLVQRSVRTLPLRMERHMKNGIAVAKFLESHACVRRVNHPGLPSHPQHKLSVRQSFGHSGMLSFYLREDDIEKSKTFLKSLAVVTLSSSLGSIESLAELPVTMSHAGVPAEEREASGVTAGLIRLSVGLEDVHDLTRDLDQALNKAFGN